MTLEPTHWPGPAAEAYEPGRGRVPLSRYWQDGPAVFVFLRHFG
jgi:hypothetical protein